MTAYNPLHIVPVDFDEACAFVAEHHRHHKPPLSHKFSLAVANEEGEIVGVAIVGRPVGRFDDNGWTLEVTRVATDSTPNACSCLYGAAWRVTRALGYRRLITFTLVSEPGTSLRAVGWKCIGERGSKRGWNCPSRPRFDTHPLQMKLRWEVDAS